MVQIRENVQKQLSSHDVDVQLLCAGRGGTVRMLAGLIIVLWERANAP